MNLFADSSNPLGGKIENPLPSMGDGIDPIIKMLNLGLQVVFWIAGLWALINFIIAGFKFMMAGGDSKKISEATSKMTMTVIGLAIIVAAPLIAMILGIVFFGDPTAIIMPKIKTI
jgi:hypothetical protein